MEFLDEAVRIFMAVQSTRESLILEQILIFFLQMRYLKVAARLCLVSNAILLVGNKNTMGVILEAGNCIG